MADVQEVKRLVKELHQASEPADKLNILNLLKTSVKASEKLIRETKVGLAVGALRENADSRVSDLARDLVKQWKNDVKAGKHTAGSSSAATTASTRPVPQNGAASTKIQASTSASSPITPAPPPPLRGAAAIVAGQSPTTPTPVSAGPLRTTKTDNVTFSTTGDKTRDKCVEMLYDALASDSPSPADQIKNKATQIEKTVFHENNDNSAGNYRSKMRSLYLNLKDKSNPALRGSVVSGDLPVSKLCSMAPADMASEQRKAADRLIKEGNFFKSLGAGEPEAETTAFQCSRCKQWKTRYRQAQTRSADEPMTTFVTCVNCGNRWKFS